MYFSVKTKKRIQYQAKRGREREKKTHIEKTHTQTKMSRAHTCLDLYTKNFNACIYVFFGNFYFVRKMMLARKKAKH